MPHCPLSLKFLSVAAFLISFIACNSSVTVKDLVHNPRKYEKKIVQVEGKVTNSVGVVGIGYFTIADGAAEIQVFTKSGLPVEGETVNVKGRFTQFLKASQLQVLTIEEGEIVR